MATRMPVRKLPCAGGMAATVTCRKKEKTVIRANGLNINMPSRIGPLPTALAPYRFHARQTRIIAAAMPTPRGPAVAAMIRVCLAWNLYGAKAVGNGSILLGILMLSPFALITVFSFFRHVTVAAMPPAHGSFLTGILVAMWNYMGWDNASTVANEVDNPQKTY